jgi:thiamine-phosphate diphosphorylase
VIAIERPLLMLVTDRRRLAPEARTRDEALRALDAQLDEALESGIDIVQIRERDLDAGLLVAFTRRLVARAGDTRILVNDRADVALAAGTDGVHLRGDSVSAADVRTIGRDWTIGRSVHEGDEVLTAANAADYLLFGTVFPTVSKAAGPVSGVAALGAIVGQSPIPVLAVGGITPVRAAVCAAAGAAGIAAIGLFLPPGRTKESLGVRQAVSDLRAALLEAAEDPMLE